LAGKRRRTVIVATFIAIFALLSLPLSFSRTVREALTGLFSPVLSVCRSITGKLSEIWNVTFHGDNIVRQNLRKEREVLRLQAELALEREKTRELGSLHYQLQQAAARSFNVVAARVIAREPDILYQTLLINLGRKHGVRRGMAVAHGENLVGRITELGGKWSRVRLIVDVRSSVPVAARGGGVSGIVVGSGPGQLKMTLIRHTAAVSIGDVVMTTYLRPVLDQEAPLPPGLVVGKVASISHDEDGLYQSAILESAVNFSNLREVLVVKPK
jgi:rod shape-determining protein MreC